MVTRSNNTFLNSKQESASCVPLPQTFPSDETSVIQFINSIIVKAINQGASDIHFEPFEKFYRIRMRIDGVLYDAIHLAMHMAGRVTTRIKILSELDIAERRIPQDGRFQMQFDTKQCVDFRVSTCPTVYGEKIVIRILDTKRMLLDYEQLGFEDKQKEIFLDAISKAQGMILVTGPTGSGKTITLYAALHLLNTNQVNILTVEDPVEIDLPGINQVQINPKAGLTFANTLRAFLRQDPDIIMVGEIRDLETAEIAIKAAQTGHLVLSTLHTNNAVETIYRLMSMGIPPYQMASSLSLIIAQRLVRKLCQFCKALVALPKHMLLADEFIASQTEVITTYRAVGCEKCTEGYSNRVGVFELLPITDLMGHYILQNDSIALIEKTMNEQGWKNLKQAALSKAIQGITSLDEVNQID